MSTIITTVETFMSRWSFWKENPASTESEAEAEADSYNPDRNYRCLPPDHPRDEPWDSLPWYHPIGARDAAYEQAGGRCEVCGEDDKERLWCYGFLRANDHRVRNHALMCYECADRPDWREIVLPRREPRVQPTRRWDRLTLRARRARRWFSDPHATSLFARRAGGPLAALAIGLGMTLGGTVDTIWVLAIVTCVLYLLHATEQATNDMTGWWPRSICPSWFLVGSIVCGAIGLGTRLTTGALFPVFESGESVLSSQLFGNALALGGAVLWGLGSSTSSWYIEEVVKADRARWIWMPRRAFWVSSIRMTTVLAVLALLIGFPPMISWMPAAALEALLTILATAPVVLGAAYVLCRVPHDETFVGGIDAAYARVRALRECGDRLVRWLL